MLTVMYSASLETILSACSILDRPFCVGFPRGRHLKGATAPANNEIVPISEDKPVRGGGVPFARAESGWELKPGLKIMSLYFENVRKQTVFC